MSRERASDKHEVSQEYRDNSAYRYEKARNNLRSAKKLFENDDYASANNRAYYAIFHAIRAVLALDQFDSKKHSGVISEFRLRYIKTGVFSKDLSDMVGSAFEIRNDSDYEDMFIASKAETEEQIRNAEDREYSEGFAGLLSEIYE